MRSLLVASALALLAPAGAAASPAGAPATPSTAAPGLATAARATTIKLRLIHPLTARGRALVLVRRPFLVRGYTRRFAPGQKVALHAYRNGKRFSARRVPVRRGPHGSGRFYAWFKTYGSGRIGITALHRRSLLLGRASSRPLRVPSYYANSPSRPVVLLLQRKLAAEGYAIDQSGYFDSRTARALLAFRKVNRLALTYSSSPAILHMLLAGRGGFHVRYRSHGRHVEGDLGHQVLALIDAGGKVHAVYPMSSGKPSTPTVLGHFRVYRRSPGTNSEGMVFSSYFTGGYAVHGYASVPTYAASHGCLRVPVPDAVGIYDWIRFGTPVDVYH